MILPLPVALLPDVGGLEILVIGVVALLLFGRNLPHVARSVGRAWAELRRSMAEASAEITREMNSAASSTDKLVKDLDLARHIPDTAIARQKAREAMPPLKPAEVPSQQAGHPPGEQAAKPVITAHPPGDAAPQAPAEPPA